MECCTCNFVVLILVLLEDGLGEVISQSIMSQNNILGKTLNSPKTTEKNETF